VQNLIATCWTQSKMHLILKMSKQREFIMQLNSPLSQSCKWDHKQTD